MAKWMKKETYVILWPAIFCFCKLILEGDKDLYFLERHVLRGMNISPYQGLKEFKFPSLYASQIQEIRQKEIF